MMKPAEIATHLATYTNGQQAPSLEQQAAKLLACVQAARRSEPYLVSAVARESYAARIATLKIQHADLAATIGALSAKMAEAAALLGEV